MASICLQGAAKALRAISTLLPQHTKRLVLWSTLYGRMCGGKGFTKEQSARLNKALVLCKDHKALSLPAQLGKFIWSDLDACCVAARKAIRGENSFETAATEFVRNIPSWLRYASDTFMRRDFQSLLSTHQLRVVA